MDKISLEEMRLLAVRLQDRINKQAASIHKLTVRVMANSTRIHILEWRVYQLLQENDDLRSALAAYMTEFKRTASYIPNEKN